MQSVGGAPARFFQGASRNPVRLPTTDLVLHAHSEYKGPTAVLAIPSARGAGLTWKVGPRPIREVANSEDPPAHCRRARPRPRRRVGWPGGTRCAVLAHRGALSARPAQGRVGNPSRRCSEHASTHPLLSAQASVFAGRDSSRPAAAWVARDEGATPATRIISRAKALATVALARRPVLFGAARAFEGLPAEAQGSHRGQSAFARPFWSQSGPRRAKGVKAA
jgi:hypothetical protein